MRTSSPCFFHHVPRTVVLVPGADALEAGLAICLQPFRHLTLPLRCSPRIRIHAPGAVSDLGKPGISGISVKIGVRKNFKMFVFYADYGKGPVLASFGKLMNIGHNYVPRFSLNFNVRHIVIVSITHAISTTTITHSHLKNV
ncbi:hypothetical protein MRX96_026728 [Rhipicephalus microplus]